MSDEDEKRPEETEPKPVCRFYTRGQCTWGMSCRFLHPGVTDKGNYTMFDMVRPVPINAHAQPPYGGNPAGFHDMRNERPPMHHPGMHGFPNNGNAGGSGGQRPPIAEPVVESAWERGLRTAKEMMRKANKRKEQDMDFEDKKMNLSSTQDDLEKDNYYARERSPERVPLLGDRPAGHHPVGIAGGAFSPPPRMERIDHRMDRMDHRIDRERMDHRMDRERMDRMDHPRMGDRMADRMGDRMPERMADRMGDRMPDRMPDRMADRMGDRMGGRPMPNVIRDFFEVFSKFNYVACDFNEPFSLQQMPFEEDAYGRSMRYRELPAHRMPQYEDEIMAGKVSTQLEDNSKIKRDLNHSTY